MSEIFHYRSIRCARILIHMNLFASFATNNFLWLLWYYLMFTTDRLLEQVRIYCSFQKVYLKLVMSNNNLANKMVNTEYEIKEMRRKYFEVFFNFKLLSTMAILKRNISLRNFVLNIYY